MGRPRPWVIFAHAWTMFVMLFQSILFRKFFSNKGREWGVPSLKQPSESYLTEKKIVTSEKLYTGTRDLLNSPYAYLRQTREDH